MKTFVINGAEIRTLITRAFVLMKTFVINGEEIRVEFQSP